MNSPVPTGEELPPETTQALYVRLDGAEGSSFNTAQVVAAIGEVASRYGLEATVATNIESLSVSPQEPLINLTGMTTDDIVRLHGEIFGRKDTSDAAEYAKRGFNAGLMMLPTDSPEAADAAFQALASAAESSVRATTAVLIPWLVRSNSEIALGIWESLLNDNVYVSRLAKRAIDEAVQRGQINAEQSLRLLRAYRPPTRRSN